jgi:hypothetical protein
MLIKSLLRMSAALTRMLIFQSLHNFQELIYLTWKALI